ncbi:MAG: TIGR00366 family protein [Candidatus Hydrogenedentota bacterium]
MFIDFLRILGDKFTKFTQKWMPDSFVIVIILSVVTFILALIWGDTSLMGSIKAWGDGFWFLLEFAMQMCLIMMTGYIFAVSPPVRRIMDRVSAIPNPDKPYQAVLLMALFSMILAWLNWGLSLIGSAMFALFIVKRNPKVDYRLLIAAAYLGLGCTWHSGLSGSATLIVATPDNFLIKSNILENVIPTTETIFSLFNLILTLIITVVISLLMAGMHPKPENTFILKQELLEQLKLYEAVEKPKGKLTPSEWLNWWPGFNLIFSCIGIIWLVNYFFIEKGGLTLNTVNFIFLIIGLLLHYSPRSFLKACEEAGKTVWGVIIQFPFYAGIFGLFKFTALATFFTELFVTICSSKSFLLIIYWYAGGLNYLIPSGGSEWAVTAPYLIPASKQLGIELWKTVITYAWGDMLTDMIQPFWAIAMLAVAKLEFKEIMGWLLVVFVVYFFITSIAFWILTFI